MLFYYAYFLIYAFLGWCMESSLYTYKKHHFVNRGFLNGPLCPVYGVGMVIIIFFLQPFQNNLLVLFGLGLLVASMLEYLTGFVLESLFHARWWDYSQKKFNLNGYICLQNSLAWGVLCVMMMHFVQPVIHRFVAAIPQSIFYSLVAITLILLIIDLTFTIIHLVHFNILLHQVNQLKNQVTTKIEQSKPLNELHQALLNNSIELKTYIEHVVDLKEHVSQASNMIKTLQSAQLKRMVNTYLLTSKNKLNQETLEHIKHSLTNK